MPIEIRSDALRHDQKPIPHQPRWSCFPLYLSSTTPIETSEPTYTHPYTGEGMLIGGMGFIMGGLSQSVWKTAGPILEYGGLAACFAAVAGGLALCLQRKPDVVSEQLFYFDNDKLIIDNFDGHPEAYDVRSLRIAFSNLYHPERGEDDRGDFLCLYSGKKKNYIGTFLQPDELQEVKEIFAKVLARYPRHHNRIQGRSSHPRYPDPDRMA